MLRSLIAALVFLVASGTGITQSKLPNLPVSSYRTIGNLPLAELNQARMMALNGRTEDAVQAYDAMLTRQPNWIPALADKAHLLNQMGRDQEARKALSFALRLDPIATRFHSARSGMALLPFIALYPRDWLAKNYLEDDELLAPVNTTSSQDYLSAQLDLLLSVNNPGPNIDLLLRKSRGQPIDPEDVSYTGLDLSSRQWLDLTLGNLAMLNYDLIRAMRFYNDAVLSGANWPELYYNRGLVNVLLTNYPDGCADLDQSHKMGLPNAGVMLDRLCNY